ncbi:MAG: MerC domain-containing protein [Planctomycetaceae bacterium]|nr:MerC domain-containing protein [Planctomycetaceae bacterium]
MSRQSLSSRNLTFEVPDGSSLRADLWGALLSLGCVVHCLAAPLALVLLPLQIGTWLWSSTAHAVVAFGTTWLVGIAIAPGYREHRRPEILFLATLGCGLVILASLRQCSSGCDPWRCLSTFSSSPSADALITLATPVGAAIVLLTHMLNLRWRRLAVGATSHFANQR